jgi:polysaccharide export outer membrane protein
MPGDQLDIRMYDFPDLTSALRLRVNSDGTLHLPYAGTIQVEGLSPSQAESSIVESLRNKGIVKEPNVTVDVVSAVNSAISVMGQVSVPKSIPVFAPVPVSYVLSQVGGITGLAAHYLTILHPGAEPPTTVDYDPDAPNLAAMNTLVAPGDIVNVSSRGVFFIAGEVNRPGIYPLGGALSVGQIGPASGENVVKNITLLQALAQAGGITAIAARSRMLILRAVDGKRELITVDQVKLYKGEVADPILHANDIIYIPTSYIRLQTNNLFSTALSSLYAAVQIRQIN